MPKPTKPTAAEYAQQVADFRATATDLQARADFAASRAEVILPLIDEQSTVRYIFKPEQLQPGAEPRYDIPFEDIDATWVMPHAGGIPTVQVEGAELHVPTFGIDGGVEYSIDVARDGRVPVAQLATTLLKNKFIKQEEAAGWSLIRQHSSVLPSTQLLQAFAGDGVTQTAGSGQLNIYTINSVVTMADGLGIGGRRVSDLYVSALRFGDLRNMVTMQALPFDFRTRMYADGQNPEGPVPEIRIHRVYRKELVADNKGYAFTQKEGYFYGVMPIREEYTTRDNPISVMEWKLGIIGRGRIGFGIIDSLGLICITF